MQTNTALKLTDHFAEASAYNVYAIQPLNSLVGEFMKLHQHVLKHLPKDGRHWVKRRHFASIKQHLEQGHIGLGAFDASGAMVGQMLLTFPDLPGALNLKGYPIGDTMLPAQHCAVIQTLGVSKAHRGRDILPLLFEEAEITALSMGRPHLLAKTDVQNIKSVNGFKKFGYNAGHETTVEGDPYKCVFMHKKLRM